MKNGVMWAGICRGGAETERPVRRRNRRRQQRVLPLSGRSLGLQPQRGGAAQAQSAPTQRLQDGESCRQQVRYLSTRTYCQGGGSGYPLGSESMFSVRIHMRNVLFSDPRKFG